MTSQRQAESELTAKQRLALSRYALVMAVEMEGTLWVDLLRVVARRCLHRQGLKRDQVR
jgi:hypothetical protein